MKQNPTSKSISVYKVKIANFFDSHFDRFIQIVGRGGIAGILLLIAFDWIWVFVQGLFPFWFLGKHPDTYQHIKAKPFAYYEEALGGKNLFSGAAGNEVQGPEIEILRDLELRGIFLGNQKRAVFFNAATNQSYFVGEGESVENYRVVTIKNKGVILESTSGQQEVPLA